MGPDIFKTSIFSRTLHATACASSESDLIKVRNKLYVDKEKKILLTSSFQRSKNNETWSLEFIDSKLGYTIFYIFPIERKQLLIFHWKVYREHLDTWFTPTRTPTHVFSYTVMLGNKVTIDLNPHIALCSPGLTGCMTLFTGPLPPLTLTTETKTKAQSSSQKGDKMTERSAFNVSSCKLCRSQVSKATPACH